MAKKLLFSLFVSVFLLALVSSMDVNDVSLGDVIPGQTVTFNVNLDNSADNNIYTVTFDSYSGLTLPSPTVVSNKTSKNVTGSFAVPSNWLGSRSIDVRYWNGSSELGTFTIRMNVDENSSLSITKVQELTYSQNGKVRVTNNGNTALTVTLSSSGNALVTLSSTTLVLNAGNSTVVDVSASDLTNLQFGNNPVTITATSDSVSDSVSFNLAKSFCPSGQIGGNLSIEKFDISNSGDKDDKWIYFDTITIEVRVKNVGDDDVDNVIVQLGLFDSDGNDVSDDLDFINEDEEQIEVGDLSDGDKETVTFEFRVPADFNTGSYKVAVKAYSDDLSQNELCADKNGNTLYESVSVASQDDEGKYISFDNVDLSANDFTCPDSGTVYFNAYNVGNKDQDRVKITLYNDKLGINQAYEIKNFDRGDDQKLSFNFNIPSAGVKDGNYILYVTADYDYRNGNYRQSLDDDFEIPIKLIGCSVQSSGSVASISTSYDSAVAGKEAVVEATIRNLASGDKTFVVNAEDFSSWAELEDISDDSFVLSAGEFKTVTMTLLIDKDASAEESFTINAVSGSDVVSKNVRVYIEPSSSGFSLNGNYMIWIIGAVNVVLILLIILVAVRLSRR